MSKKPSALVIGAGIAGIQSSLDLAELGVEVHLIEQTSTIGGRMPQLDKTFPTNDCSMCILSPKMSEVDRNPLIHKHIKSHVNTISGEPGNFTVTVKKQALYVDPVKCVSCGLCEKKCPVKVDDEFDMGLRKRGAISRYFLQSIPAEYTIDPDHCLYLTKGVCRICEKTCPADAINFDDTDREIELSVGSVIVAAGIDPFDPEGFGHFGHGRYPNVVTSLEFERMLSASGPLGGHIVRASDHAAPKRIAFIQCVGSRDESIDHNWCSSACCMFALKEAIIAREHDKSLQPVIFYMDIRAFGKDFDKYYDKAENTYGIGFVKSKVSEITETESGNLVLRYVMENGEVRFDEFDMVVLSIGLQPRENLAKLASGLGIKLNTHGFIRTEPFKPLQTTRPGIYVCGAVNGPKDIPESVFNASGSVANACWHLDLIRQDPPEVGKGEKFVIGDRPRIGAFICSCGINIAGVVDVKDVTEYATGLPNVEHAENLMYACSPDGLETIKKRIEEHGLNRVVVAACTPRTHEPLFRETIAERGLNPYLFEMANIRDQCSWPHMDEPELATSKSRDLVRMAAAKARGLEPLQRQTIDIHPDALVIGAGLAGMTAALSLAEAGHKVTLVEREMEPGGNLKDIRFQFGADPQKLLRDTLAAVEQSELIDLHVNTDIGTIDGYVGNFETTLIEKAKKTETKIKHGAVVVATGAVEHQTEEYLCGVSPRVLTLVELERMIEKRSFPQGRPRKIVMIQCVGSREEGRMYCSRVCCTKAVKNGLELKKLYPHTDIYIAYRDVRTYGFRETYYAELRDKGAVFLRYTPDRKPVVEPLYESDPDGTLAVRMFDPIVNRDVVIDADYVVLATAIDAREENSRLAKMLKVPLNEDGMFLEAHVKLRPVDFATEGVFVCGLAHGPKDIDESLAQAKASAARALTFLNRKAILAEGTTARVNEGRCTGCGYCEAICAYSAIEVDPKKEVAVVNDALCKGCGACVASCRCGALDLRGFTNDQLFSAFNALELTGT